MKKLGRSANDERSENGSAGVSVLGDGAACLARAAALEGASAVVRSPSDAPLFDLLRAREAGREPLELVPCVCCACI